MWAYKFTPFSLACLKCLEIEVEVFLNDQPGDSQGACVGSGRGDSVKDLWRAAVMPVTWKVCPIMDLSFRLGELLIVWSIVPFLG